MKRILLKISYDGTNYKGWQKQPNTVTVEGTLNEKLTQIMGEEIEITGVSRTDSGVHALCNIAVFDTNTNIPGEKIKFILNRRLPRDIIIQSSKEVPREFHPRDSKSIKTYEYQISNTKLPIPINRLHYYHVHFDLNLEDMRLGASYLEGTHDFRSFCISKTQTKTTVRTIHNIDIAKEGDIIRILVSGDGFLYNMVRCIVGTLIYVGRGMYPPEHVKEILIEKNRQLAGPNAPAHGLILKNIEYLEPEKLVLDNKLE